MIVIYLGNLGSGKTACAVRTMYLNKSNRKTYSNIVTKIKHQVNIMPSMIIKKKIVKTIKRKTGEREAVYKYDLNKEYWQKIKEPINVIIDEAHSIINARRASSKINIVVMDWLALLRRVLGQTEAGFGELVFITQLPNRLDIIARDMATQIRYHICHYLKHCKKCGLVWKENSEMPEGLWNCMECDSSEIEKFNHRIEVWHFPSMRHYNGWKELGQKTFYKHYFILDIEKYFKLYDTLQWDNLFSEYY